MATASGAPKLADLEYRVVRSLGTGAGSTIFLIHDTRSSAKYALKIVKRQSSDDDIYLAQAQHEFEVAGRLHHRCLVTVHDCRSRRSWLKLASVELLLEFIDGRNLDEIALKDDVGQLILIFNQMAAGLMHMHRRGVYHGDLKPSNVMVSREGLVKIIDFGTAWIRGQDKGRIQGTVQYMAPEQADERVVDEKTDLYNLGATMYRMLTGEYANLALPGGDHFVALNKIRPPMSYNSSIPGPLNEAVMDCLKANPDRRPAGVFEVRHRIQAAARYLGLKAEDLQGSEGPDDDEGDDDDA